ESLPQYHSQDILRICAQRHADADLVYSLVRGIRNNAVNADNGENQTEHPKGRGQHGTNLENQETSQRIEGPGHLLRGQNRQVRRQRRNYTLDLRDDQFGSFCCAHLHGFKRVCLVVLEVRDIEVAINRVCHSEKSRVFGNSHHLDRVFRLPCHSELPAECVLIGPESPSHGLINNRDILGVFVVGVSEHSSSHHWDAHRLEVVGRDHVVEQVRCRLVGLWLVTIDSQSVVLEDVTHWNGSRGADRQNTGYSPDSFDERLVEFAALCRRIPDLLRVHAQIRDISRIEAKVGLLCSAQAAHEESGDDEQHERAGDLRHDKGSTQAMLAADQPAAASAKNGAQIPPRGA